MLVFDASPLIVLASADRLSLFESFEQSLVVPAGVREEVVDAGLAAGHADARRVESAIDRGLLDVVEVSNTGVFTEFQDTSGLSEADAAVLAHAQDADATAVLDESAGRSIAAAAGIETRGTAWLILSRVEAGAITVDAGRAAIDDIVAAGWYCSTDLYRQILATLESLE